MSVLHPGVDDADPDPLPVEPPHAHSRVTPRSRCSRRSRPRGSANGSDHAGSDPPVIRSCVGAVAARRGWPGRRRDRATSSDSASPRSRSRATWSTTRQNGVASSRSRPAVTVAASSSSSAGSASGARPASNPRTRRAMSSWMRVGTDGHGCLGREDREQLHVGHREGRRAALVEDLEDADGPVLIEERHGRDRARHVSGLLRRPAVEAWVGPHIRERQRLPGGIDVAGDSLGRRHGKPDRACAAAHRRRRGTRAGPDRSRTARWTPPRRRTAEQSRPRCSAAGASPRRRRSPARQRDAARPRRARPARPAEKGRSRAQWNR